MLNRAQAQYAHFDILQMKQFYWLRTYEPRRWESDDARRNILFRSWFISGALMQCRDEPHHLSVTLGLKIPFVPYLHRSWYWKNIKLPFCEYHTPRT